MGEAGECTVIQQGLSQGRAREEPRLEGKHALLAGYQNLPTALAAKRRGLQALSSAM